MTATESITIPTTMKRLVATAPGKDIATCKIEVETVPVPQPASGEVLIKVAAAPINPSDYGDWYRSSPDKYPFTMGKEGCGVVVASGGGLSSLRFPVGSKVGFIAPRLQNNQGSYSEYVTAPVTGCFAMPDDTPIEDCASFFVNPYTAIGIIDTVKNQEGSPAFVHTAAASQLGQMIVKLAPSEGVEVINVVRREEQAEILRELGAKHIVVTANGDDEEKWKEELKAKVKELGAKCAFDAIAGSMAGDLLEAMPPEGSVYVYGVLGGLAKNINPLDLVYRKKQLKGFFLTTWVREGGLLSMVPRMISASRKVNSGLKAPGWSSTQFSDTTMEKAQDDIVHLLGSSITGKKLRIRFD
mmetsp:Transcript_253/g.393  ORF Transcript_253/g.393 Transcript_253/m.393 type:complete len:356 (+) Transcript_253:2-1069(+)